VRRRRLQARLLHRPDVGRVRHAGHLVFAYEGPTVAGGPQQVYVSRRRTRAAPGAQVHRSRLPERTRRSPGSRRSAEAPVSGTCRPPAGTTPTPGTSGIGARPTEARRGRPVKISDAPAGAAAYVAADGFAEVHGDYGEIGVTNTGKTVAAWGEGFSYTGPGGTWFNIRG
jgi:hypothetical protein